MLFITCFKIVPGKAKEAAEMTDRFLASPPEGVKIHATHYTLGWYDAILIFEAPREHEILKILFRAGIVASQETFVAMPRTEIRGDLKL
ncbi:MAG: hypothetical protein ABIH76_08855 [Candidatus Bathyarchaeota archaeon]